MFTDFFGTLWENILALLTSILPTSQGLPSGVASGVTFVVNLSGTVGYLFPIGTLFQIILLGIGFEVGIMFFKVVMAVLSLIRGAQLKGGTMISQCRYYRICNRDKSKCPCEDFAKRGEWKRSPFNKKSLKRRLYCWLVEDKLKCGDQR